MIAFRKKKIVELYLQASKNQAEFSWPIPEIGRSGCITDIAKSMLWVSPKMRQIIETVWARHETEISSSCSIQPCVFVQNCGDTRSKPPIFPEIWMIQHEIALCPMIRQAYNILPPATFGGAHQWCWSKHRPPAYYLWAKVKRVHFAQRSHVMWVKATLLHLLNRVQ